MNLLALVAHGDAHGARGADLVAVDGHELGLAGDGGKRIVGDDIVHHANGLTVLLAGDELRGVYAEVGGEHAVIGARAAAALHVARDDGARFDVRHLLLDFLGKTVGDAAEALFGALGGALLFLHLGFLNGHRAFGDSDDGEGLAVLGALGERIAHLVQIVRDLRQEDDVCAACNAGIQRQPAGLVAHDLDDHDAAVAGGGGMNAVDDVGGDVNCGMEAEGHVRAPDVVVNRLGQTDDIESLFGEQVRGLVRAVAAQTDQTVQLGLFIGLLHRFDLVDLVLADDAHLGEGGAAGTQNGAAQGQDAGEVALLHLAVVAFDQAGIAILNTDDFGVKQGVARAGHAADTGVQAGAVAAGGEDADASFHDDSSRS